MPVGNRESPWASAWTLEDWTTSLTAPLTLLRVSPAPPGLPPADWAVGASPRPGKHLEETGIGDLFDGPLSPPARSPRSLDFPPLPSPTSTLGYRRSARDVSPRIPDLSCPSLLPCVGSLDPRRVPDLLETSRAAGVRASSSAPAVCAS